MVGPQRSSWQGPALVGGWCVVAVLAVWAYAGRLTAVEWKADEVGYRNAGVAYLRGEFTLNTEHPFLVKYLYGAAQLLAGSGSPAAVRTVSVGAALLTTLVVAAFAHRVAGRWAALLAGLLWVVLPHPVQLGVRAEQVAPKLERIASLDAVMVLFVTLAMLLTWRWVQDLRWHDALLAGAAVGLATGSKASALFAVGAFALAVVAAAQRDRQWARLAPQAAAAAVVSVLVALATYLPDLASAPDHVRAVLANAETQAAVGHAVIVAGERYDTAPWWSLAYWQWAGQGTSVTVLLTGLSALALWRLPRRLAGFLLLCVAVPLLWLSLLNGFLLSHYLGVYQAPLALLAALVLVDLLRGAPRERLVGAALTAALVLVGSWHTLGYVATLQPTGYAVLQGVLDAPQAIAVSGEPFTVQAYYPEAEVTAAPVVGGSYDAVVVDPRRPVRPEVAALLASGAWRVVVDSPAATLYVPV